MEALAIAALLLLPGAWIAFALRDGATSFGARMAWSVTLAPLVVAAEFFLARRAAGSFPQTAWLVAALNVPAVILIWRRWRARIPAIYESSEWEMWRGVLIYGAIAACAAMPWLADPDFRAYSWHGLLHLDVIYSIANGGAPWEAELADVPLSYPWAPHVAWALEAAAAQRSPTLLYPINNLLLLAACGMLAYELARSLGASKAAATAATAFLALGPNLPGLIGWSLIPPNDDSATWALLGDLRYTPFLLELVGFEPIPLGVALQLGLAGAVVRLVKAPRRQEMLLLGFGLFAMAALHPNLYPAGAALALGGIAVLAWRAKREEDLRSPAVDVAGWAAAGLVGGYFVIHAYSEGRALPPAELASWADLARKLAAAALGLGPFLLAAYFYWRSRPERRPELTALAVGAGGALVCNLILRMGGRNEYELYFAAGLVVVAPAVLGLGERLKAARRLYGWITWATVIALAAVMAAFSKNRVPKHEGQYLALDERAFFLSLGPRNPDGRWMTAVRVKTELETILVIDRPEIHVSAFTARRLFVGSEGKHNHAGCNEPSRFNLVDLRGYDPDLVDRRLDLMQRVFRPLRPTSDDEKAKLLEAIAAEAGPNLTFVFLPGDDRAFLDWLQRDRHVRVIYDDGARTVIGP